MKKFNVLIWDINANELTTYDVLPYFRNEYKERKKKDRPTTKQEWEDFVRGRGIYRFFSRCEYEIIISNWPSQDKHVKIDVWEQIEQNFDLIVEILMNEKIK